MDYHWLFPIIAGTIYLLTPRGCNKTLNWILTGLFVLIWAFEEAIIKINEIYDEPVLTDGLWYDATICGIFAIVAGLFYYLGGKLHFKLALMGVALSFFYLYMGNTGLYYEQYFRDDYYYVESMIALYIAQLFVSSGGMMFSLTDKIVDGASHVDRTDRNRAGNSHARNGGPRC